MADGRLDEAYDQAVRDDVRQHRRGQKLISRLVDRLLDRGQAHVDSGQLEQALTDFDRAAKLGGNQPRIAKYRHDALSALDTRQQQRRRRSDLVAAVRRHIDRGELSAGAQLVEQLSTDDAAIGPLSDDIAARRLAVEAALARAEQALGRQSYETAIGELLEVRRLQPSNPHLAELTEQLAQAVVTQVRGSIEQGRLDLAASLLEQLKPLVGEHLAASELARMIEQCGTASSWLEKGNVHQALRSLTQLGQLLPGVKWIQQATELTERASSSLDAVRGGPLGLVVSSDRTAGPLVKPLPTAQPSKPSSGDVSPWLASPALAAMKTPSLPSRLLLQVDGAGSYVVVRNRVTTIGPVSSSDAPLVGLLAPANLPTVSIERLDDDYFLRCDGTVTVNGKSVSKKLLSSGDRIALSSRLDIRFFLPNAASTSAVLELTGARLPRQDVRRIILLDESIILGNSGSAHVRVQGLEESVVLHLRHGQLVGRVGVAAQGNGLSSAIAMNKPVQIGPVSLVVTETSDHRLG